MCGIVAATTRVKSVIPILLTGLARLEYRGYDSAGLAWLSAGKVERLRSVGRVAELAAQATAQSISGQIGIAHTRWATHGVPSEKNAHPHCSEGLAVVHNGIIENYAELKTKLQSSGYHFSSDTDSEVIAHLMALTLKTTSDMLEALRLTTAQLVGAYAIAVLSEQFPDKIVVARQGAPLLIGISDEGHFAVSDVAAILDETHEVIYLENGDLAEITPQTYRIIDQAGVAQDRPQVTSSLTNDAISLGQYQHFMQKEIFEQPEAIANTLDVLGQMTHLQPGIFGAKAVDELSKIDSVLILACGTSFYAGLVARQWMEQIAEVGCVVDIASEYRYRMPYTPRRQLVLAISQSGETADTIAAARYAVQNGSQCSMAICNVPESSLVREATLRFITHAGPEIGVASTKAFTTQLVGLFILALVLAKVRGRLTAEEETSYLTQLRHLPAAVNKVLALEPDIKQWSAVLAAKRHVLFLGRGLHFPIALEGALKMKELTYIHAEGYPAGELKHGPLALVDSDMPVIAVAPNDNLLEKLKSNLQEVHARGGQLFVFADADSHVTELVAAENAALSLIRLPEHYGMLSPVIHTIPLQLLAYHVALALGTDVDKPRNLAKSVTVE